MRAFSATTGRTQLLLHATYATRRPSACRGTHQRMQWLQRHVPQRGDGPDDGAAAGGDDKVGGTARTGCVRRHGVCASGTGNEGRAREGVRAVCTVRNRATSQCTRRPC
jgi:hypothetical protein